MKQFLISTLLITASQCPVVSQCVLNGSFEQEDSTYYSSATPYLVPSDWTWALPNTPCTPANLLAVLDTISYSGASSVKLESQVCVDDAGYSRLEDGILFSGGPYFTPRNMSFGCNLSPSHLNFHYMFHQEGNDSGYVKIMLFNYDSLTPGLFFSERIDTVAFSSGYINQEATSFTPFSLPINYLTADTPAFMHIFFSTSKTLSEHYGNTSPYLYAYPGTTLWIDDVDISGGNVSIEENELSEPSLFYPNPATDVLYFRELSTTRLLSVNLSDMHGRKVISTSSPISTPLNIGYLAPGLYLVRCNLSDGQRIMDKLLVQ